MRRSQQGFSLVPAIFLVVVVASLVAFAIRIGMGQQDTQQMRLLSDRAYAAAQSGLEWGAYRALVPPASCPGALLPSAFSINGFTVTVTCISKLHVEPSGSTFTFYDVTAQAQYGSYGSPDFVYRQLTTHF